VKRALETSTRSSQPARLSGSQFIAETDAPRRSKFDAATWLAGFNVDREAKNGCLSTGPVIFDQV
jgi:hypothetical protein